MLLPLCSSIYLSPTTIFFFAASEPRDVLVERHNRLSAAIRILNEAYQVIILSLMSTHQH